MCESAVIWQDCRTAVFSKPISRATVHLQLVPASGRVYCLLCMEGRCGRIMQTSTRRVKTQRVVITFLRVVDLIQSQRIFYYALVH